MNITDYLGYKELYFIEMNVVCVSILAFLFIQWARQKKDASTGRRVIYAILSLAIVFSISDMLAGAIQDHHFTGSNIILYIGNIIYFASVVFISACWAVYALLRAGKIHMFNKRKMILFSLPAILFFAFLATTPLHGLVFKIDSETSAYSRGTFVFTHWIVCLFYVIYGIVAIVRAMNKATSKIKKGELQYLLYFPIAPVVTLIFQIVFSSLTFTQFGITFSALLLYSSEQRLMVLTDDLTKLNNRRSLEIYIENTLSHTSSPISLAVLMIDINRFKEINDTYGHLAGDVVLKNVADSLRVVCEQNEKRLFLCRYGGDEFLVVGKDIKEEDLEATRENIKSNVTKELTVDDVIIGVSASVGIAVGICTDIEDAEHLIRVSDEDMYLEKKKFRNQLKEK